MNLSRRSFLAGLIAAPAIVKASSLMPVKAILGLKPRPLTLYFDGTLADAAVWDEALSPDEIIQIAAGANPLAIRPNSLRYYAPVASGFGYSVPGPVTVSAWVKRDGLWRHVSEVRQ